MGESKDLDALKEPPKMGAEEGEHPASTESPDVTPRETRSEDEVIPVPRDYVDGISGKVEEIEVIKAINSLTKEALVRRMYEDFDFGVAAIRYYFLSYQKVFSATSLGAKKTVPFEIFEEIKNGKRRILAVESGNITQNIYEIAGALKMADFSI